MNPAMQNGRSTRARLLARLVGILLLFLCSKVQARAREVISDRRVESDLEDKSYCPCQLLPKPDLWNKALTARWMAHSLEWGVLTTISSRLPHDKTKKSAPVPFGNVYSFVDGSCDNSTGIPYFYGTYMDQSFQDIRKNPYVSLTLSEASLATVCGHHELLAACDASARSSSGYYGDVESPVCARMTLSGRMVIVEKASDEFQFAQQALFQRHPDMEGWPQNHEWIIAKLELLDIWLIDYFGGASIIKVDDYLNTQPYETTESKDSY